MRHVDLATRRSQTIVYRGRRVYSVRERHDRVPGGSPGPIELHGTSPDGAWVPFAIDPQGSHRPWASVSRSLQR